MLIHELDPFPLFFDLDSSVVYGSSKHPSDLVEHLHAQNQSYNYPLRYFPFLYFTLLSFTFHPIP